MRANRKYPLPNIQPPKSTLAHRDCTPRKINDSHASQNRNHRINRMPEARVAAKYEEEQRKAGDGDKNPNNDVKQHFWTKGPFWLLNVRRLVVDRNI
jgi:hypothetical protein